MALVSMYVFNLDRYEIITLGLKSLSDTPSHNIWWIAAVWPWQHCLCIRPIYAILYTPRELFIIGPKVQLVRCIKMTSHIGPVRAMFSARSLRSYVKINYWTFLTPLRIWKTELDITTRARCTRGVIIYTIKTRDIQCLFFPPESFLFPITLTHHLSI